MNGQSQGITLSPHATYTEADARYLHGINKDNVGVKFSVCQQCFDRWHEHITDMSALVDIARLLLLVL